MFQSLLHNKLKDKKYSKEFVECFSKRISASLTQYNETYEYRNYQTVIDSSKNSLNSLILLSSKWNSLPDEFRLEHKEITNSIIFQKTKIANNIEVYKEKINNKILKESVEKDVDNLINQDNLQ